MACRLASVPVLTVSVLKRLQDLGTILILDSKERQPSQQENHHDEDHKKF
jgi:hypothetical protein